MTLIQGTDKLLVHKFRVAKCFLHNQSRTGSVSMEGRRGSQRKKQEILFLLSSANNLKPFSKNKNKNVRCSCPTKWPLH